VNDLHGTPERHVFIGLSRNGTAAALRAQAQPAAGSDSGK